MKPTVAVVIPTYKAELTPLEEISLAQCRKVLGNYPLIFFAPEGKIFPYFKPGDGIVHFPAHYFQSVQTYCQLLMNSRFYEAFREFDYILIYQLDAFVFYDALEEFCCLGYDYIGAPWSKYCWKDSRKPRTPQVGNGGFSLRKVQSCLRVLRDCPPLSDMPEDAFFAWCGVNEGFEFTAAPVATAQLFSMEHNPARHLQRLQGIPFGCHNWQRFSADFYVKLMARFGYDLRSLRGQMGNEDVNWYTPNMLSNLAMERLVRRAERNLPVGHYLPTKHFASIRVLRDEKTLQVLTQLITEVSGEIFMYDSWIALADDVIATDLPQLIMTLYDDDVLIELIESRGLIYGRHVISYQREVLNWYEKFFHNLGK